MVKSEKKKQIELISNDLDIINLIESLKII